MQVSKKENAEIEPSLKVSWGEGLIVPSFSYQEFNFAFSLSVLRYTCSYSALVTFSFFSSTLVFSLHWWRESEWEKSSHELNNPIAPCQCDFCLKFELSSKEEQDPFFPDTRGNCSSSISLVLHSCF